MTNFNVFNEADVREEILAPILKKLGYEPGTRNNLIREQSLRYPKSFLGRKNPHKDPELRGIADYVLEVDGLIRWVLEAKAPSVVLSIDVIEQAWSYANHAEVRAVYFVICNGYTFSVFQTQHGPNADPIISIDHACLQSDFHILQSILGPDALMREFPKKEVDVNPPLGPGLRSVARISRGWI